MSVNFTDKDQNSISLMNVSYYESKAEYIRLTFLGVKTDEDAAELFSDEMERGFIHDITCGTYNGATGDFTPWQINDNNILDTIYNHINEIDFFNDDIFMASYLPEEHEEIKKWSNADWVREYTEVYEVFIIGGSVYVNID